MTYEIINLDDLRDARDQGLIKIEWYYWAETRNQTKAQWLDADAVTEQADLLVCLTDSETDPDLIHIANGAAEDLGLPRPQRYAVDETETLITVYAW
jgi:hypothetical protein